MTAARFLIDYTPATDEQREKMDNVRREFEIMTRIMLELPRGPEHSAGMRKLLEAKDSFVRAVLEETPLDEIKQPLGQ